MSKGFQFKQFFIEHQHCAMKVGTDSIMLGAWTQARAAESVLDIGCGSGLLGIMLAQKTVKSCQIDGIDIDPAAIEQATSNAINSPWQAKLSFKHCALQQYESPRRYDLIVSNPPYFPLNQREFSRAKAKQILARQCSQLEHHELIQSAKNLLSEQGRFCCVLPVDFAKQFRLMCESEGLYCGRSLYVRHCGQSDFIRHLLEFSFLADKPQHESQTLTIKNDEQQYTEQYKNLCRDYYLHF